MSKSTSKEAESNNLENPPPSIAVKEEERPRIRVNKETLFPFVTGAGLLFTGFLAFLVYRSYIWSAFLALLLFVGFDGFNRKLIKLFGRFKGGRDLSAVLSSIIVMTITLGPAIFIVRLLISEAIQIFFQVKDVFTGDKIFQLIYRFPYFNDLVTSQPFFWVNLQNMIVNNLNEVSGLMDTETIGDWLLNAYNLVLGSMTFTINFAVNIFFALVLLYFLFRDGEGFFRLMERRLPIPPVYSRRFAGRMKEILQAVIKGNVFVSVLQGTAVSIGLSICDIPNSVLYGSIAAVFSLVPVIGTAVVWLPVALYLAFINHSYGYAIFLAIYGTGMYVFLENIFKPLILDKKLGIHPLFLFLAIIGGIKEFGITGVIIGPLFVTLFMTVWNIYHFWESGEAYRYKELEDGDN